MLHNMNIARNSSLIVNKASPRYANVHVSENYTFSTFGCTVVSHFFASLSILFLEKCSLMMQAVNLYDAYKIHLLQMQLS